MRLKPSLPLTLLFTLLLVSGCAKAVPDRFGIYLSDVSGHNVRPVIIDPAREMTHARFSPDGTWLTFTRYNDSGLSGIASEEGGYAKTEIMLVRPDGSGLQSVVAPQSGVIAANSSFTPDGKGLIYLSTDNAEKLPQIMRIDLVTKSVSRIPTPAGEIVTDPHWVGNLIAFPLKPKNGPAAIWLMNSDGTHAKQLSHPVFTENNSGPFEQGDYDPRISPDGTHVVFMRLFGKQGWHIYVADLGSGKETDISGANAPEGIPDWSADGRKLIFWHIDLEKLEKMGIYTMDPDGHNRSMIPLPRGYLHGHPGFDPAAAFSDSTRIVYSAQHNKDLP